MIVVEKRQEEDLKSGNILFLDLSSGYEGILFIRKGKHHYCSLIVVCLRTFL